MMGNETSDDDNKNGSSSSSSAVATDFGTEQEQVTYLPFLGPIIRRTTIPYTNICF